MENGSETSFLGSALMSTGHGRELLAGAGRSQGRMNARCYTLLQISQQGVDK